MQKKFCQEISYRVAGEIVKNKKRFSYDVNDHAYSKPKFV